MEETHGLLLVLIAAKSFTDFDLDTCKDCTSRNSLQGGFILKRVCVWGLRSFTSAHSSGRLSQFVVSSLFTREDEKTIDLARHRLEWATGRAY